MALRRAALRLLLVNTSLHLLLRLCRSGVLLRLLRLLIPLLLLCHLVRVCSSLVRVGVHWRWGWGRGSRLLNGLCSCWIERGRGGRLLGSKGMLRCWTIERMRRCRLAVMIVLRLSGSSSWLPILLLSILLLSILLLLLLRCIWVCLLLSVRWLTKLLLLLLLRCLLLWLLLLAVLLLLRGLAVQ